MLMCIFIVAYSEGKTIPATVIETKGCWLNVMNVMHLKEITVIKDFIYIPKNNWGVRFLI
jgi:hypothetical protein